MAGTWTSERFPQFKAAILQLTKEHRELADEPLHLALAYLPHRNEREIYDGVFLFEVIGGEASRYGQSDNLFEVSFDAAPGLPTGFDQTLHLILTTPAELEMALGQSWPLAVEVADAVRRDDYKVLYQDRVGGKLLRQIRAAVHPPKRGVRG